MKKSTKKKTVKPLTLKDKFYKNRYLVWTILLPIIAFAYDRDCFESFQSFRFLIISSFLLAYTAFLLWAKKGKAFIIKSVAAKYFFGIGGLFLLWNVVCSIFAILPNESLFPLSQMTVLGISIFFVMESLKGKDAIQKCFKAFSILIAVYATIIFLQISGLGFTGVPGDIKKMPTGLAGNRNLIGGFFTISYCIPAYLAIQSEGKWKWFGILTALLSFVAVILSQTRTAWVVLFSFMLLLPIGWVLIQGKQSIKGLIKPAILSLVGIIIIGVVAILFAPDNIKKQITERIGIVEKGSTEASSSFNTRINTWGQTFNLFKDHPIVGVGAGNWKLAIPKYGTVDQAKKGDTKRINTHNLYLQVLSETGAIGFIMFILMFYFLFLGVFKLIKSNNKNEIKILALFLTLGIVTMLMDGLASFSNSRIEHSFLFAFFIGALLSVFQKYPATDYSFSLNKKILLPSISLLLLSAVIITHSKYEFSKNIKIIRLARDAGDDKTTLQYAEQGKSAIIKLDELGTPIEMYTTIAYRNANQFDKAFEDIKKAIKYNPNNSDILNTYGTIYLIQEKFPAAMEYFEKAIQISPNDPNIKKNIVMVYYFTNKFRKALKLLKTFKFKDDEKFVQIYKACQIQLNNKN